MDILGSYDRKHILNTETTPVDPVNVINTSHRFLKLSITMSSGEMPTIQRLGAGILPIPTFVVHREIVGIPTELSIQVYDDRIMVLLSQLGNKVGCLVSQPASRQSGSQILMGWMFTDTSIPPSINTPNVTKHSSKLERKR